MIKKRALIILFLIACNIATASVNANIRSLIETYHLHDAKIGISIKNIKSKKIIYDLLPYKKFKPASNNKLFTATAALLSMNHNYQYTTTVLYKKQKIKNNTLKGNLYIKFTGDPTLSGTKLNYLIKQIRAKGIYKISGNIVLIANRFTGKYIPPGWENDDRLYCYGAAASSLTMNRNCFTFNLIHTTSNKMQVKKLNNSTNIKITNEAVLESAKVRKNCPLSIKMDNTNHLLIKGCLKELAEFYFDLAIANPALKTLDTVKDFVKDNKISYTGKVKIGSLPKLKLTKLFQNKSASLSAILHQMLITSNNLYAETVVRTVGYYKYGIGSTAIGVKAAKSIIRKKLRLNTNIITMRDGSGLSHLDRVTPNFMVDFLTKISSTKIGNIIYHDLPTSGVSGTLTYRMSGVLLGKVHAKTGTLSDTSALSGYVLTKKNHNIAFSILLNNLKLKDRANARAFQNNTVKFIYNNL